MSVIGVVAALTVPEMMTSGKYQELSTRFSKFVASTEEAATAKAAEEGIIEYDDVGTFLLYEKANLIHSLGGIVYILRDKTVLLVKQSAAGADLDTIYKDESRYGKPLVILGFQHNVKGIPNMKATLSFVLTNKGYVLPNKNDACASAIYENSVGGAWKLTSDMVKEGGACFKRNSRGFI